MRAAADIVAHHPGCSKKYVAERISPLRDRGIAVWRNWSFGYNPINRAIDAGLILAVRDTRGYRLYPTGVS